MTDHDHAERYPVRTLGDCVRNDTYWQSLSTSANLAGWKAARDAGLWDVKQADAIVEGVLDLVRERLVDWDDFHHLRNVHGIEPDDDPASRAEQHRAAHLPVSAKEVTP